MSRAPQDLPSSRPCSHPGCKARMWKGSHTYDMGLCKLHGGAKVGRAEPSRYVPPEEAKPPRQGVRVATVVMAMAFSTNADQREAKVSLVREPWL
jgi:hypothetical protein